MAATNKMNDKSVLDITNNPAVADSPVAVVPKTPVWTQIGLPDINSSGLKGKDKILAKMEAMKQDIINKLKSGVVPWRHQVDQDGKVLNGKLFVRATPKKVLIDEPYTGMNFMRLQLACAVLKYTSNYFGTIKQWGQRIPGLHCIKGTHTTTLFAPVLEKCYKWDSVNGDWLLDSKGKKIPDLDSKGNPIYDHDGRWQPFYVVNLDDMDPQTPEQILAVNKLRQGDKDDCKVTFIPTNTTKDMIECKELDALPGLLGCELKYDATNAKYRASEHAIYMPDQSCYENGKAYYSILLHECVHATKKELNRPSGSYDPFFGPDDDYAREELVAEFASISLMSILGMHDWQGNDTMENSAAYINSWLTKLQSEPDYLDETMYAAKDAVNIILKKLGEKFPHLKLRNAAPAPSNDEHYGAFDPNKWIA